MDKSTKILLGLIALGLWVDIATSWIDHAVAADSDISSIGYDISLIKKRLTEIAVGDCGNAKIC